GPDEHRSARGAGGGPRAIRATRSILQECFDVEADIPRCSPPTELLVGGAVMLRQAVILVGGLGTRLGERTRMMPKPMLDVGGRPFLDTLIDELARYDVFDEILLLAGYRAESIQTRYEGAVRGRARLAVSLEQAPLGTAGALVHAEDRLHE